MIWHFEPSDTEGYVIPSLELEDSGQNNSNLVEVEESKTVAAEVSSLAFQSLPKRNILWCQNSSSLLGVSFFKMIYSPSNWSPCSLTLSQSKKEENIYLGPHGAPPSQSKQQELGSANNRKQKFRQKLKEADKKYSGSGRENKVEHLRELVGGKMAAGSKNSPKDWLDPHCDENMFQRNQR